MNTQKHWVVSRLNQCGRVSRNEALENYISRLGAIICDLKKEGWQLESRWERTAYGRDFVYTKQNRPLKTADEANAFLRSLA